MFEVKISWATAQEASAIAEIYTPIVRDTAISFETEVPSSSEIAKRIKDISSSNPYIVAKVEGEIAGYAYSVDFRTRKAYQFTKEATVYVHKGFRKMGLATLLYDQLFELLKFQGVVKVMAVVTIPNDKSVRFHEKYGFQLSGTVRRCGYKYDQFWDVSFYEKEISENMNKNPELVPWDKVKNQFPELTPK